MSRPMTRLLAALRRVPLSSAPTRFAARPNPSLLAIRAFSASSPVDPDAEFALGVEHLLGKRANASVQYAVLHWTNAAEKGHAKALSALGNLYLTGHADIPANEQLAVEFLRKAADAGHAGSCHEVGKLYFHGSSQTAQDLALAFEYWSRAAEDGHMAASYDLGYMYLHGLHVAKDEAKSIEYFTQAAKKGMSDAHRALGNAYLHGRGVEVDAEHAVAHFRRAAEEGNAQAQFDLGACYMLGRGVEKSQARAAELFFLASETGGMPQAQLCLAQLFETGGGVVQDTGKAIKYYQLAWKGGLEEGKKALERLGAPLVAPEDH